MKKKKHNLLKLFKQNRHCLVTMFIMFVIVFGMTFDSFAQNQSYSGAVQKYDGNGSFTMGSSCVDYYNLTETNGYYPVVSRELMYSYYSGSGDLYTSGSNDTDFPYSASNFDNNWLFDNTDEPERQFDIPTQVAVGGQTLNMALNSGYFIGTYEPNTQSYKKLVQNYKVYSPGNIAIVNYGNKLSIVSNQPITYMKTVCRADNGDISNVAIVYIDEVDEYGNYVVYFETREYVIFTDMPIYLPSSDGASGFTGVSDFSFANDNTNFNNLIVSGIVPDPSESAESIVDPDGTHYNYASADPQFNAFNNNGISCKWSFVLNDYMKLHPDDFQFHAIYNFNFKLASGTTYKFTARHEPMVSDILLNGDALYNTSDLYHSFLGDGNLSMATWLQNIFNQSSNTSGYYSDGSVISYGLNQPGNTRSFGKFTLGLQHIFDNVVVSASFDFVGYFEFLGDPREESGKISGTYDLKNGDTKITQNDITKNLNPPSEYDPQYPQTLNPNTSGVQGAVNSAVATIASGAIQISTGGAGFQMSQADWNHFGDLIEEMRTDLTTLENNNTSFPMVVKNTFDFLPAKIWTLIFLGITGSVTIALWNKAAHNH